MGFNIEYLNTLCPNGFPRHNINLKPGMPLILLWNISPKEGLCNGTKLIYQRTLNKVLLVRKLAGNNKEVHIQQIKFIAESVSYPFEWARGQFSICIAFATTINKSQGQSLKRVGVWLRVPVFSHGQLYVASSSTRDPDGLKFAIKQLPDQGPGCTRNEV